MKKINILLLVFVFVFSMNIANAQISYDTSQVQGLACGFTRVVTNAFGCNFIAKKIATSVIKKKLKKNISGDYDVKIDSFSAIDLKRGKFKSFSIDGKNLCTDGIHISSMHIETINKYNYIEYNKNPIVFHTDLPMKFETVITEDDLNKTLIDIKYFQTLINMCSQAIPMVNIDNVNFKLKNNKIYLIINAKVPLLFTEKRIKITFSGKLNIENGRIVLDDVVSENFKVLNVAGFIDKLNNTNPFDIPIKLVEGANSTISVNNVKVVDNKLYIDGIIVVKSSQK